MTRTQRKLIARTVLAGLVATLAAVVVDQLGLLIPLENALYDARFAHLQRHQPSPSDQIAFLDVDDPSLDAIGRWPWPRTTLAQMMGELRDAGAKAVVFDMLFSEPQALRSNPQADGSAGPWIDDDAAFAQSLDLIKPTLIPLAFSVARHTKAYEGMVESFTRDLEQDTAGVYSPSIGRQDSYTPNADPALSARREAMARRISAAMEQGATAVTDLRRLLLPHTDPAISNSPLLRLLTQERQHVLALRELRRLTVPTPAGPPRLLTAADTLPPIPPLAAHATATGFVYYLADPDGVVRSMPLLANVDGRLYPQTGLSLACAMMGVPTSELRLGPDTLTIPRSPNLGGDIVVPIRDGSWPGVGQVGAVIDVPWLPSRGPGARGDWARMFDADAKTHLPIVRVWDACQLQARIRVNTADADEAIRAVLAVADESLLGEVNAKPLGPDDSDARLPLIQKALDAGDFFRPAMEKMSPADMDAQADRQAASRQGELEPTLGELRRLSSDALAARLAAMPAHERADTQGLLAPGGLEKYLAQYRQEQRRKLGLFLTALKALPQLRDETVRLVRDLQDTRAELRQRLSGKGVLIGWTATSAVADFVPTSLHAKCPGVVVHAVVCNGILTQRLWRRAPPWVTPAMTILSGVVMTGVVAAVTPFGSFIIALLLAAVLVGFNGVTLFDKAHVITGLAGPLLALAAAWGAGAIVRFVVLDRERRRIKSRFQSYVDPELVNYYLEHPEEARLAGQRRELSVVFTDLAGFTTLTEKLGEDTVPLLNEYMGLMVPLIRRHRGYVNKFLGDGIMFFFGAPRASESHAVDAIDTALAMQAAMPAFNAGLAQRGLPPVAMRIGISTGAMIVGDAGAISGTGGDVASDYTVLGDTVNLGSRLEGANKATGTLILVTARTIELAGDRFLARLVGTLIVKGSSRGLTVYTPLVRRDAATPEQTRLAELTVPMVTAYTEGRFGDCLVAADRLEQACGPDALAEAYRAWCAQQQEGGAAAGEFHGHIVLTEK